MLEGSCTITAFLLCLSSVVWANIRTVRIGDQYAYGYDLFEITAVKELGLRGDWYINEIRINGIKYGRPRGTDQGSITLGPDEYINDILYIKDDSDITFVAFKTNYGREIRGGKHGSQTLGRLNNIRLLGIGGSTFGYVDFLLLKYIENYEPSQLQEADVGFILTYSPPFGEFEEYTTVTHRTTDSYEIITGHMINRGYSTSVIGEFYMKAVYALDLTIIDTRLETIRNEITRQLVHSTKKYQNIPDGYVGVKLVRGNIMKQGNEFWMYPTTHTSYSVIKLDQVQILRGYYDLTGMLHTQMTGLRPHMTKKYGFTYYSNTV